MLHFYERINDDDDDEIQESHWGAIHWEDTVGPALSWLMYLIFLVYYYYNVYCCCCCYYYYFWI